LFKIRNARKGKKTLNIARVGRSQVVRPKPNAESDREKKGILDQTVRPWSKKEVGYQLDERGGEVLM